MKYVFKRKPRPYQLAALQKAMKLDYATALWFDPGLGKTKVAIDFMGVKASLQQLRKVLVVCPLSAIGVWEDEIPEDLPDNITRRVIPIVGEMQERIIRIKENMTMGKEQVTVMVVNYDSLRNEEVMKLFLKWKPELLIVDEMHFTKNHNAQRSKYVYKLRKFSHWVLGLTGTPIPKNYLDVFGQYKILDERIFGTRFSSFRDTYAICHHMFKSKVIDWRNLDDLAKKLHTIAYRVKDTESSNLSELIIRDIPVYLSEKTKKHYKQMAEEMMMELENMEIITANIAAVKIGKLQQLTGGFIQRVDKVLEGEVVKKTVATFPIGTEKLDVCMDLIDNYVDNHKILIGCRFLWEIKQIENRLTKKGIKYFTIKGGVTGEERTQMKRTFQSDTEHRVIIFQVSAATAMTLTAADIAILYSCTQKWDDYWQWLKRIHRDGQTKPVNVLRLVARGTVDKQIMNNLKQKSEFTSEMIDKSKFRDMIRPEF